MLFSDNRITMSTGSFFPFLSILALANTYCKSYKIPSLCYHKPKSVSTWAQLPHSICSLPFPQLLSFCLVTSPTLGIAASLLSTTAPLATILDSTAPLGLQCLLNMSFLLPFICWTLITQSYRIFCMN